VAVASKFLAVGAVVPWARAGSGNLEGKVRDDELIYESLVREIRDITAETDP
jgi:hypothetical protein